MEPGLIWILAGLVGLGAELLAPGVYFLWAGIAAIGTGLVMLIAAPGFAGSVALFLAMLAGGVALSVRLKAKGKPQRVNAPEAGLAGRHAMVTEAGPGGLRVRLGDSDWSARPARGAAPALGDQVRVDAVDGTVLVVSPLAPR